MYEGDRESSKSCGSPPSTNVSPLTFNNGTIKNKHQILTVLKLIIILKYFISLPFPHYLLNMYNRQSTYENTMYLTTTNLG